MLEWRAKRAKLESVSHLGEKHCGLKKRIRYLQQFGGEMGMGDG